MHHGDAGREGSATTVARFVCVARQTPVPPFIRGDGLLFLFQKLTSVVLSFLVRQLGFHHHANFFRDVADVIAHRANDYSVLGTLDPQQVKANLCQWGRA